MAITLYHNPRCSKSRAVKALLDDRHVETKVVEYLKTPLSASDLRKILKKLGLSAGELVRKDEKEFRDLGLSLTAEDSVLEAISEDRAVIGRPPEKALSILQD